MLCLSLMKAEWDMGDEDKEGGILDWKTSLVKKQ